MKTAIFSTMAALAVVLTLGGCGKIDLVPAETGRVAQLDSSHGLRSWSLSGAQESRILALNPERVTDADVRHTLAGAPAPHIITIHGGIATVIKRLESFSRFLNGLGYPEQAMRHPGGGNRTISCYEDAEMIAGIVAWYYEREGMRPMIIGHSQGSVQAVKALQLLAGQTADHLSVWSPIRWRPEDRTEITDPLTGKKHPVVGLKVSYIAAMGGGGATRVLPNQWDMMFSLRSVPDSVEEFTGFYLGLDVLGGDMLGWGSMNHYRATGSARVRNVKLPTGGFLTHGHTPDLDRMLSNPPAVAWINNYVPSLQPVAPKEIPGKLEGIEFGADVWKSVKRHWVIELQRLIRARHGNRHGA